MGVLSSFYWGEGGALGIPDGKSDCALCTINCGSCQGMPRKQAHDPTSKGYDKGDGEYTRAHRDAGIVAAMRTWMGLHNSVSESTQIVVLSWKRVLAFPS